MNYDTGRYTVVSRIKDVIHELPERCLTKLAKLRASFKQKSIGGRDSWLLIEQVTQCNELVLLEAFSLRSRRTVSVEVAN